MNAVCTILGCDTAGAAATGAGIMMLSAEADAEVDPGVCCSFWLTDVDRSSLLPSLPPVVFAASLLSGGVFVPATGAEGVVGVVTSIGSPGDGADIFMVGVRIGTVLAPIGSSGCCSCSKICFRDGALSVIVAICRASVLQQGKSAQVEQDQPAQV